MTNSSTDVSSDRKVTLGRDPSEAEVNAFLAAFKTQAKTGGKTKELPNPVSHSVEKAREAYWSGDWDTLKDVFRNPKTQPKARDAIRKMMLEEDGGRMSMAADPDLAAIYIGSADPEELEDSDLLVGMGRAREEVVATTLLSLAKKKDPAGGGAALDRDAERDPKLFALLAESSDPSVWNDSGQALGSPKRGLGPRVCAALWNSRGYDEICKLIELDVDTTIAAQSVRGDGGVYSGFVVPLQHSLQEFLPDIDKLGTPTESTWDERHLSQVKGAKQIFEKLEATEKAATLTKWQDVKNSEIIAEFQKNPGTIWGFEKVRAPFVQAAHETAEGIQPVRMMELWDAIARTLQQKDYAELIENPKAKIKAVLAQAVKKVGDDIDRANKYPEPNTKYDAVRRDKDAYMARFEKDATAVLTEFASQIPRGTLARMSADDDKLTVANIAGTDWDKFTTSFACKAGLWMARNEGKPVYYCLDGINMEDATDYKKTKNKAIENYLAEGGAGASENPHKEVVTMKEVREILRNWDEMKDTVRFVRKGTILKDQELLDFVDKWQMRMEASNKEAGRTPAPPRARFAKDLAAIDPNLAERLDQNERLTMNAEDIDKDARDIVRKAGYLLKISNSNPEYVVKYLMSKCEVLVIYDLIPGRLVEAARNLGQLAAQDPPASKQELEGAVKAVEASLKTCAPRFRKPLAESMVRHPLLVRSKKLKKMKKG